MDDLSDKQKRCDHNFCFLYEDVVTGKRVYACYKCGVRMDGEPRAGTMDWKARKMLKATGKSSVTLGEACEWFDKNHPDSIYAGKCKKPEGRKKHETIM